MLVVLMVSLISDIPQPIYLCTLFAETIYPTLGDDDDDTNDDHDFTNDCYIDGELLSPPQKYVHPGYAGPGILDTTKSIAPDGLCLYHCLAAAADWAGYTAMSTVHRELVATEFRQKTIALLLQQGMSIAAERLGLSGYDGYPDEPDFFYIASATGVSFEISGISDHYVPFYGTSPVAARIHFGRVKDGAGHESDHYDLEQIYAGPPKGNGRWRLRRKTGPASAAMATGGTCLLYTSPSPRDRG